MAFGCHRASARGAASPDEDGVVEEMVTDCHLVHDGANRDEGGAGAVEMVNDCHLAHGAVSPDEGGAVETVTDCHLSHGGVVSPA